MEVRGWLFLATLRFNCFEMFDIGFFELLDLESSLEKRWHVLVVINHGGEFDRQPDGVMTSTFLELGPCISALFEPPFGTRLQQQLLTKNFVFFVFIAAFCD
jgi:hypothetical protein